MKLQGQIFLIFLRISNIMLWTGGGTFTIMRGTRGVSFLL